MSKTQASPQMTQAAAEQPLPMKVYVKIGSIWPEGSARAFASINLNDCFAKVVDSTKDLFVTMSSYKTGMANTRASSFPRPRIPRAAQAGGAGRLSSGPYAEPGQPQQRAETSPFEQVPEQGSGMKKAGPHSPAFVIKKHIEGRAR